MNIKKITRVIVTLIVANYISGCSSIDMKSDDPFEEYNREMFEINSSIDREIMSPIANMYDVSTNDTIKRGVNNFFENIKESRDAVNNLLQGKLLESLVATGRVTLNTTFGIGGIFDLATIVGMHKGDDEDFGQTLGLWGVPSGAYVILPLLGPSTVRDTIGLSVDITQMEGFQSLYNVHNGIRAPLNAVNERNNNDDILKTINSSDDPYDMMKILYMQKREYDIYGEQEIDF
jgi:phospholipid-binding lipoprotein MlaA